MKNSPKILVLRFSSFGDIVLTYPFLNELRRLYPESRIDFVVKKQYSELVNMHPSVNNIYLLSDGIRKTLKKNAYDLVFNLQGNPKSIFLSLGTGKRIFKVRKDTLKKLILVNFRINLLKGSLPVYAKYLKVLNEYNSSAVLDYSFTENLKAEMEKVPDEDFVLVSPSSKHFTKRLPADKFIEILSGIDAKIILTGDDNGTDTEICGYIYDRVKNAENLCGKLLFPELAGYISKSKYVICNDSGVLHLAESLNKKVFVFFGSTVREFGFYPQSHSTEVFDFGPLDCKPCSHIGKSSCRKGHFMCMNGIDILHAKGSIKKYSDENLS